MTRRAYSGSVDGHGTDLRILTSRGWSTKRLRFCIIFNPRKSELRNISGEVHGSFVPMEAVGEYGGMRLDQTSPIDEMLSGYTYFRDGDVVVAKITPCFENGKGAVAIGLENGIGFGTTELHVLRPRANIDKQFLFYITISHHFRHFGTSYMVGSAGQKRVPEDFIRNLSTAIPPLSEQHAIAAFLDRETERIDSLIAKKQRQIELLNEKRAALISRAVTKGLNPDAKMKDSGIDWLREIPEHWKVSKIRFEATMVSKGTTPSTIGAQVADEGIRFIKAENIHDGKVTEYPAFFIDEETDKLLARSRLMPHDVLVVIAGATTGKTAVLRQELLPANTNQAVCFIRLRDPGFAQLLSAWISTTFVQDLVWNTAVQSAQPNLAMEDVKTFPFFIPPNPEKRAIAEYLDHEISKIDGVTKKVQCSIERLREYRTALITAAVTGKIDVHQEATHARTAH